MAQSQKAQLNRLWDRRISGKPLQWRHNGWDGVSNHQPHHCLFNRLFRRRSNKTSMMRVTGLCVGNSPVTGELSSHLPPPTPITPTPTPHPRPHTPHTPTSPHPLHPTADLTRHSNYCATNQCDLLMYKCGSGINIGVSESITASYKVM